MILTNLFPCQNHHCIDDNEEEEEEEEDVLPHVGQNLHERPDVPYRDRP
jgi:hypothetical protein